MGTSTITVPTREELGDWQHSGAQRVITELTAAKADIDALTGGDYKQSARAATTGNLVATRSSSTLTATGNGALAAQDGVTMAVGDRILVKDQSTGADNGVYTVTSLGSGGTPFVLTRAADFDATAEVTSGCVIPVTEGTVNGDKLFALTTNDTITINSTSLTFALTAPGLASAAPSPNGTAAVGTGTTAARADHVHQMAVVRGVVFANVAALATFTVAGNDGLTYIEGQRVLLVNQTTAAENGIYVVGVVGGGTAPLTRAADMPAAASLNPGMVVEVSEGTIWAGSSWKAMTAVTITVGTHDPDFYPRCVKGTITLVAGTITLGATQGLFLHSVAKSALTFSKRTGNTTALTVSYGAPAAGRTAGKSGTAAAVIEAEIADSTINVADVSTLDFCLTNW